MSVIIKDNKDAWNKFVKNMETIGKNGKRAQVGIFRIQGKDLVQYAAANEFGTDRIPQRSFLRAGIDEQKRNKKLQTKVADLIALTIEGKITPLIALLRLGEWGAVVVKKKIDKGPFFPLAPLTIKRKGHDTPLIETGRLRRNITSRVK